MKKFLPLLFLTATLAGASVEFRGGRILNAELSARCPAGMEKLDPQFYELPKNRMYAALTIVSHSDRVFSIFDYSLFYNVSYPCIAIREENGPFRTDYEKDYSDGTGRKKFTLLFILNRDRISGDGRLYLKANFPPEQRAKQLIRFRMIGEQTFTSPGAVPAAGLMPEK